MSRNLCQFPLATTGEELLQNPVESALFFLPIFGVFSRDFFILKIWLIRK